MINNKQIKSPMSARPYLPGFLLAASLCLFNNPAASAKMYKWVDDNGKTVFSDQVTPEEIQNRHEKLSKQGRVVEVVEPAKTKDQLEQEKRLSALRKEQEKLIVDQKIHDKSLLSTYHSKEEIMQALNAKMQTLEAAINAIKGDLVYANKRLEDKQKTAAVFERNAQKIPTVLLEEIKAAEINILAVQNSLNAAIENKEKVKKALETDVERFMAMTQAKAPKPASDSKVPSIEEANDLGLFFCENDAQCNRAWDIAKNFVKLYSTTGPDVDTDKLFMYAPPAKEADISLSLSKIIVDAEVHQLFIDIRCSETPLGRELCNSRTTQSIRSAFRPYVNENLSRPAKQ